MILRNLIRALKWTNARKSLEVALIPASAKNKWQSNKELVAVSCVNYNVLTFRTWPFNQTLRFVICHNKELAWFNLNVSPLRGSAVAQEVEWVILWLAVRSPPPPVHMSKWPWAKHWIPNCSWWLATTLHRSLLLSTYECMSGQMSGKNLWIKALYKCSNLPSKVPQPGNQPLPLKNLLWNWIPYTVVTSVVVYFNCMGIISGLPTL